MSKQEYTSKSTDICQVSRVFKNNGYSFPPYSFILDYGGGKCDKNTEYMRAKNNSRVIVYDPFNRSSEHNAKTWREFENSEVQYITCNNVLNVIKEEDVIIEIIQSIAKLSQDKGAIAIFTMHEGNKSGQGAPTPKGWQRNQKVSWYADLIKSLGYFSDVKTTRGMIICTPIMMRGKRIKPCVRKDKTPFRFNVREMF